MPFQPYVIHIVITMAFARGILLASQLCVTVQELDMKAKIAQADKAVTVRKSVQFLLLICSVIDRFSAHKKLEAAVIGGISGGIIFLLLIVVLLIIFKVK